MNRDTICVQGGYTPATANPPDPTIQSTTFKYATSEDDGRSCLYLEADGVLLFSSAEPTLATFVA